MTSVPHEARARSPLFTVGDRSYDLQDVVTAAILRGEWSAVERQVRQGLACLERARRGESPAVDLEPAALEFRYARNLITAEETEAWLERAGLAFDDWTEYLERSLLRRTWAHEIDSVAARFPVNENDVRCRILAEAICSGELERLAEVLAGRAAFLEHAPSPGGDESQRLDDAVMQRTRLECSLALGASDPGELEWRARIHDLARLEAGFQAAVRRAIDDDVLQSQVDAHRIDWVRVLWRVLALPDEQMAREAALCLRHEGESLDDVAMRSGFAVREERLFLDDVDEALRAAVVSARPEEPIGPFPTRDGFLIAVVLGKVTPALKDSLVRARAEDEARLGLIAEKKKHVRWHQRV